MQRRHSAPIRMRTTRDGDRPPPRARHPVRIPIFNSAAAIWLVVVSGTLAVLTCEPERRDQESEAWSRATGHPQGISALAFNADGKKLATGGDDGAVAIWDVGQAAACVLSRDRPARVHCLAFSPDDATLAAGYEGVEVVLWDVATREKAAVFHGHPGQFLCIAFSPDGRSLASGGAESEIRIWDVQTGGLKTTLTDHHGLVSALRFAPDGQTLASGYTSGTVKLWNLAAGEGRELMGLNLQHNPILGLAFSPDGSMLAAGSQTHGTRLWDVVTGRQSTSFRNEDESIPEVAFTRGGQMLVEVTLGGLARLRNIATGRARILMRCRGAYCSALTPDARFLAAGDDDAIVRVWDLARVDLGTSISRGPDHAESRFQIGIARR